MQIASYDHKAHRDSVRRIWREVGWLESGPEHEPGLDALLAAGPAFIASVDGAVECSVSTAFGDIDHLASRLPYVCVTSVTTGRAARRQGLAARLAAHAVAHAAASGACVAGLSVFDQGFYDRIGFGAGGYEHVVSFDPASVKDYGYRPNARRIAVADAQAAHAARLARRRAHGSCSLASPEITRSDMQLYHNGFGLGYRAGPGGPITHYLWLSAKDAEHGPYDTVNAVYQDWSQFLELLGLLRTLSDQAHLVRLREPAGFQLQDVLDQPFRSIRVTESSRYATGTRAAAYWQMRICDLAACLGRTALRAGPVRFNLDLSDPIAEHLPNEAPWRGVAGHYIVTLGPDSSARPGVQPELPLLTCGVGAFTRLWLGVLPASSLAATGDLRAAPDLLAALDDVLCLPRPSPDWDF